MVSNSVRPILCVICAKPRQTSFFLCAFFASSSSFTSFSAIPQNCVSMLLLYWHTTHMPINTMADIRMRKYNFHLMFSLVWLVFSAYALHGAMAHYIQWYNAYIVQWGFYVYTYYIWYTLYRQRWTDHSHFFTHTRTFNWNQCEKSKSPFYPFDFIKSQTNMFAKWIFCV